MTRRARPHVPPGACLALVAPLALALTLAAPASADLHDETALAERYAPVVRLVEQDDECGPGEPYEPMDVDTLFDDPTVALRGPWSTSDLVRIAPPADDLAHRYEYHLDFPGSVLSPGCDYERWARRLTAGVEPTVYAHVAGGSAPPRRLALQYWFFYAFKTSSSSSTAATRSCTRPRARTPTSSPRPSISAARPRPASAATIRGARTWSSVRS